eukprot:99339-Chlamydomonas_euryale.AAC.1
MQEDAPPAIQQMLVADPTRQSQSTAPEETVAEHSTGGDSRRAQLWMRQSQSIAAEEKSQSTATR